LQIIDVKNPENARRVGGYETRGIAVGVAVSGPFAYVVTGEDGLHVIDVSDPTRAARVGGFDTPGSAVDVAVRGQYAYVADQDGGLHVIDVSDPANCVRVGGYESWGVFSVAISDHLAYIADGYGLQIIDVGDPANCTRVGGFNTSGSSYRTVAQTGGYAYLSCWDADAGMQVFDVSDPANTTRVGSSQELTYTYSVAVSERHAYAMDRDYGLVIYDTADPTNPQRLGAIIGKGRPRSVVSVGDRVYVAASEEGLLILPTLRNVQFGVRVTAEPGVPFTIEGSTDLFAPWEPLLTTNVLRMPFEFVDYDVKVVEKPQKFYRVRQ
jgi:hypothetical protein